jgi:hypothetical protein
LPEGLLELQEVPKKLRNRIANNKINIYMGVLSSIEEFRRFILYG